MTVLSDRICLTCVPESQDSATRQPSLDYLLYYSYEQRNQTDTTHWPANLPRLCVSSCIHGTYDGRRGSAASDAEMEMQQLLLMQLRTGARSTNRVIVNAAAARQGWWQLAIESLARWGLIAQHAWRAPAGTGRLQRRKGK